MTPRERIEQFTSRMTDVVTEQGFLPLGMIAVGPQGRLVFVTTQGLIDHATKDPVTRAALIQKATQAMTEVLEGRHEPTLSDHSPMTRNDIGGNP